MPFHSLRITLEVTGNKNKKNMCGSKLQLLEQMSDLQSTVAGETLWATV
jgi:hypothetical protein